VKRFKTSNVAATKIWDRIRDLGQLPDLLKQITQVVANSMESVMLLVVNGCGIDGLRIARTMFESAVTVHYLDSHPELVQDFVDYLWVIRKRHYDFLQSLPPDKRHVIPAEKINETETNYERVKGRFTDSRGRIRNSWSETSLYKMAKEIGGESLYGAVYRFGSSLTHTDILAVIAGSGPSGDVEPVPSSENLTLAFGTAVMSYATTLTAFDKVVGFGRGNEIATAFRVFSNIPETQIDISEDEIALHAYSLWERRGRPWGSPEADWFEAERQLKHL
jgi:hypothetical protein